MSRQTDPRRRAKHYFISMIIREVLFFITVPECAAPARHARRTCLFTKYQVMNCHGACGSLITWLRNNPLKQLKWVWLICRRESKNAVIFGLVRMAFSRYEIMVSYFITRSRWNETSERRRSVMINWPRVLFCDNSNKRRSNEYWYNYSHYTSCVRLMLHYQRYNYVDRYRIIL